MYFIFIGNQFMSIYKIYLCQQKFNIFRKPHYLFQENFRIFQRIKAIQKLVLFSCERTVFHRNQTNKLKHWHEQNILNEKPTYTQKRDLSIGMLTRQKKVYKQYAYTEMKISHHIFFPCSCQMVEIFDNICTFFQMGIYTYREPKNKTTPD